MKNTSLPNRAKSTNWVGRETWNDNTETQTTESVEPNSENKQSFESLLPSICYKYCCPVLVYVKKELVKETKMFKAKDNSNKDESEKTKATSSRKSSGKKMPMPVETKNVFVETDPTTVVITARYDKLNHLLELLMKNTNLYQNPIMQVISILTPFYSSLTKIAIERCRIDAQVIYNLSKIISMTAITEICLDESSFPEANYAILLDGDENILKHLSLARCFINDVVCEQIASKLYHDTPSGRRLLTLNLSSNRITDEGAKFIAGALRSNRQLKYLNLANNAIGDEGFGYILDTLTEFPLTYDELIEMRKLYVTHLKRRLCISTEQLHVAESASESVGSIHSSKNPNTRFDTVSVRSSVKMANKNTKTQNWIDLTTGNNKSNNARAEKLDSEVVTSLHDSIGPFNPDCVVERDGWTYCKGNMILCYVNIAYNDITTVSTKKLSSTLTYQNELKQPLRETGLIKVSIEGNPLPVSSPEITIINSILTKFLKSNERVRSQGKIK